MAAGLLAGVAADAVLADPRRAHPVAAFGRLAQALEKCTYRDSRGAGIAFAVTCAGAAAGLGVAAERLSRDRACNPLLVALATWTVLGGESLRREAQSVYGHLAREDLPAARAQLTHLVGRDTSALDLAEIARAAVESVAENTSDAVVAPLFWGAVAGIPGLLGYRAVNTLDAMVGYRSPRYVRFGWAAARIDDLANIVPARATAALVALVSGRPRTVLRIASRDAPRHPSPNAGWCEAAFAAALDIGLGGTNVYGERVERRAA
ncbi:MAG: adenosylcobinamide-phosphate synthase CbiB, partial [Actinomycetota bacterium]|nr:adenosylcobinamide-phosphate synthase CbiB [Actinomycetota bacterium]